MRRPRCPTAVFSLSRGNAARTIASVLGISSAPNTPCRARKVMTPPTVPTSPMPTDVAANPATPMKNSNRRPYRSPRLPPKISSDASASM